MNKKFITTTLPYINSVPHIGHCFEFVLADVIATYYKQKLGSTNVFFNIGVDEHGQKIHQKSKEEGYDNPQAYCNEFAAIWNQFCHEFNISYNNFYRTTDIQHELNVRRYYKEIAPYVYPKKYKGQYCVGCESFKTEKEIVDGKCPSHNQELVSIEEDNIFFKLTDFSSRIKDVLVNKSLSNELKNLLEDKFDLSITRKNVEWGIKLEGSDDTFYVWFEALLNYIFSIRYYEEPTFFKEYWEDSLQICGKDNLKFQAYIFQALLLANNIPQIKEILVHGIILDKEGNKMSKSVGNVIDPIEQKNKYGLTPLRYYLTCGLNTFGDSKYSETDLVNSWNSDIANGLGNIIARTLHLVDIKKVYLPAVGSIKLSENMVLHKVKIEQLFEEYKFQELRDYLNSVIAKLNKRFENEKPFSKECLNPEVIIHEIYWELKSLIPAYQILLKEHADNLELAFKENKKVVLFKRF